jgi:hypothetical protein
MLDAMHQRYVPWVYFQTKVKTTVLFTAKYINAHLPPDPEQSQHHKPPFLHLRGVAPPWEPRSLDSHVTKKHALATIA